MTARAAPPVAPSAARLGAIVPAAGLSRRMGREKILLPFGGTTILETVIGTLVEAGVASAAIAVVLRPDLASAREIAERAGARVAVNPDPAGEMMTSIRLGLAALPHPLDAFFVFPADHPAVASGTVRRLAALADRRLAWIPRYRMRRGHPALVGGDLAADAAVIPDTLGLRELWRLRIDDVRELDVDDPGVVANADTPEDYEAARLVLAVREKEEPKGQPGDAPGI
ncbi:MAG: nucleotidyltransferase family protein [Acidobacteriota bacterium]